MRRCGDSMDSPGASRDSRGRSALTLWMWGLFLLGVPFYVFANGMPQPAYLLVPPLVLVSLAGRPRSRSARSGSSQGELLLVLLLFVAYATLVSLAWFLWLGDAAVLPYPLYYAFNLALFWLALSLREEYQARFETFTARTIVVAIGVQVVLLGVAGGGGHLRQALFFNNPNQLGYFALLAASAVAVLRERGAIRIGWALAGGAGAAVLAVASLSRSALASLAVLALLACRRRPRVLAWGAIVLAAAVFAVWQGLPLAARDRLFLQSLEIDDSLAGRGYDRLVNHPWYLLLGAGEGAFGRFESFLAGEIHSSFGTLLFAYGLPGAVLFSLFLFLVMRRCGGTRWLLLLPALAYGLTHQGLRFAMLWVLLATACAQAAPRSDHVR